MAVRSAFVAGYEAASCRANSSAAAVLCARSTPGRMRPKTIRSPPPRPWSLPVEAGSITACIPDGNPHLRPEAEQAQSAEPARRHAGDRELGSVDPDDAAGDVPVGLKPPAPAVVAQHHEGIGALGRVGRLEESTRGGLHAEHGEVVLGHRLAPHHVAGYGPRRAGDGDIERHSRHPRQIGERPAALAIVEIVLVAEHPDPSGSGVPLEQSDELVRVPRGDRTKEEGVDVADDHPVHPDAHAEGERHRQRVAGTPAHHPQRVSEIRAEIVEPPRPALVAHRLPVRVEPPEGEQRLSPRGVRRETLSHQARLLHRQVETELFLHATFGIARPEDGADPGKQSLDPAHDPPSRTRRIAAAKRFQRSTSSPSARRPCRVMV